MKQHLQNLWKRRWLRRVLALVVVLAVLGGGAFFWLRRRAAVPVALMQSGLVRTTRLQKTSLDDAVTVTGTVQSGTTSTVTTDQKYAVKEILVQVGDTVQAGDVICTLDTSELEESIEKARENQTEQAESAASQVSSATDSLNTANADAVAQESVLAQAQADLAALESGWQAAQSAVAPYEEVYNQAQADCEAKGAALTALQAQGTDAAAMQAAQKEYDAAREKAESAKQRLEAARQQCNYDSLQQQYQAAQQAVEQARQQLDQLEKKVTQASQQLETSQDSADKAGESDELEQLESQLEKCTLRASTSGKVTEIGATVGSIVNGSVAVIQDTETLQLAVTIPEYDIADVAVGMEVRITTDATDGEIAGTLSQISPVAGQDGFSATIDIADSTGLYIGMNATAEILLSTVEDVFVVPIDAVEEQEDGSYVIYESTTENGEQTFTAIPVTLGAQNDYYVEVSGDALQEGMEIRASVLEETADTTQQAQEMPGMMGGMMGGGDMGGGTPPDMGSDAGGNRPSGMEGGRGGMGGGMNG